ncbi:MAG: carboxylate-amine ligase, partial [Pseudopedobacter saltans]
DDLGSRHGLETVIKTLEKGTGADRQLEVYEQRHNLSDVVDYILSQFAV